MGRTKGVKNGEGNGYQYPRINTGVGAVEAFIKLKEQKFLDADLQLTPKAKKYVVARLQALGMSDFILFENFFKDGLVDYDELIEKEAEYK